MSRSTSENGIVIAVIGPKPLVRRTEEALKLFPSFIPRLIPCSSDQALLEGVQSVTDEAEVLLFSEYRGYKQAREKLNPRTPSHYVPLMGTGLYRSIFRLKNIHSFQRLSVDTISPNYVNQIFSELGETPMDLVYVPDSSTASSDQIAAFHRDHFLRDAGYVAMTGIHSVSEILREMSVPSEWVTPTQQDLIVTLERALLSTETRRNKESQIVVGIIHIDDYREAANRFTTEHEIQRMELDIHRQLLEYVKQLDGHLINAGGGEYLFFTTRGVFERETRGYKYIPLLEKTPRSLGITLSIGIGFGRSATDAGSHARLAIRQSMEAGGNICFIVREDRSVIGPVETTQPMIYELTVTDHELLEEAEKAGMSAVYMSRLVGRIARHGKSDYTAQELSTILGVTVRSTHRILLQWIDAGLVEIVGEEKVTTRGRPRQIYRLSFVKEQMQKRNLFPDPV
ncbi:hypothetical protein C8P63_101115 [Melghirimyces profundicolus]|uniref:GGDEF domain-containing protein n=1 Tax=Melghirimyces profundicolus TaxID=1242148 RepID=A0A2T6C9B0_9BACL|nr:hypothetical protein [Melghirimyces profundicolus]PTX64895.1 hypothetical protein C8P63_101115 [Melghirimyces profundicolus]